MPFAVKKPRGIGSVKHSTISPILLESNACGTIRGQQMRGTNSNNLQMRKEKPTNVVRPVRTMLSISVVTFVRASSMKGTCAATTLIERRGILILASRYSSGS
jgi:hypothetical protein